TSFDLSGWELQGLGYTFPAGALINPNAYLILAANRATFAAAYGATIPVFDTTDLAALTGGQTLALVQGGTNVVAAVRYENAPPWPAEANGMGSSLQLVDARQDNWRAGNWLGDFPPLSRSPGASNIGRA